MNVDVAELDERIAKCQKILDNDPGSQIFAALADAFRKKGMFKKALEICQKGLDMHPDYASAYIILVKIFLDQGNHEEADRQLKKAIAVGGRSRSVDILESEILVKLGHHDKAKRILEKLHLSDPQNETITNLLVTVNQDAKKSTAMTAPSLSFHQGEKRAYSLANALTIIKVLPKITGVVAVTGDGMMIEGHLEGFMTKEELAALATSSFDDIAQGIAKIDLGKPQEILIESEKSKLWIINKGKILFVLSTREDINLGSLRLKVNEILNQTELHEGLL